MNHMVLGGQELCPAFCISRQREMFINAMGVGCESLIKNQMRGARQ